MSSTEDKVKSVNYEALKKEIINEFLVHKKRLRHGSNYGVFKSLIDERDMLEKVYLLFESKESKVFEKAGCSKYISTYFYEYSKLDNHNLSKLNLYKQLLRDNDSKSYVKTLIMILITAPGTDISLLPGASSFSDYAAQVMECDANIIMLGQWKFKYVSDIGFRCLNYGMNNVTRYACNIFVIKKRLIEDLKSIKKVHKLDNIKYNVGVMYRKEMNLKFPWFSDTMDMVGDDGMIFVGKRRRLITKVILDYGLRDSGERKNLFTYCIQNYTVFIVKSGKAEYKLSYVGGIWIVKKISSEEGLKFKWELEAWRRKFFYEEDNFKFLLNYKWVLE